MSLSKINVNETTVAIVDKTPSFGSQNLVESGGVAEKISKELCIVDSSSDSNLDIGDENGNVIAEFKDGHIRTLNFDSRDLKEIVFNDDSNANFNIGDDNGYVIAEFKDGHIRTKNFDSRDLKEIVFNDDSNANFNIGDDNGYVIAEFKDGHIRTKNFDSRNNIDAPLDGREYVRKNGEWIVNSASSVSNYPRPVIFDTDWWTDIDDACAVRVLLWAERMGYVDVVGICINAIRSTSVPSLSSFLNYEGRTGLCIGIDKQATDYGGMPSYHDTFINNWAYREYNSNEECEDCVSFYRRALSEASLKVDIVSVGYLNALSRLLNSTADEYSSLSGIELVRQKVNHLWVMGGNYPSGSENNFIRSARAKEAAANICSNWPTEITFLGYEVGIQVVCGNTLSTTTGTDDLLYKGLLAHGEGAAGRYAWDPMTTLLACYGDADVAGYTVKIGTNVVNPNTGENVFTESPMGKHRYVIMRHPTNYYQYQLNNILEKKAWGYRKLGAQSISKI